MITKLQKEELQNLIVMKGFAEAIGEYSEEFHKMKDEKLTLMVKNYNQLTSEIEDYLEINE